MILISKCSWESPKLLLGTNKLYIWRVCYTLHTTVTLHPQFFKVFKTHRWWSIRLEKFSNLPRSTADVFCCLVSKLCLTFVITCSPSGSSVHEISQARVLEWVDISFSRGFSRSRDQTYISCLAGGLFITEPPRKPYLSLTAAAAESLQSCPTLCNPTDGSPPGFPIPGILQARTLEWVAISFSNGWKWKVKVKSLSRVRLLATPWTVAH